jgi:hypothetical protein
VLRAALASGSISADQCNALTTLGDADSDEAALESLPFWSYGELEREARRKTARELERKDDGSYLRMHHTADERYLRGEFQVAPAAGAVLMAALDARIPAGTSLRDYDRASARALVELAACRGTDVPRPTVLVTDGVGELSSGGVVGAETVELLACDASVQVGTARQVATVPASTRRAVEARDGHRCTFPGCDRDVFLQIHHIVHRAKGGSHEVSNLQLVCWTHHALIHEGGWSVRGPAGPGCTWVRPDGTTFGARMRGRPPDTS